MHLRDISTIHHDQRTLRDTFNDEAVWIKYAVVAPRLGSRLFFNSMSRITGLPIFHSTHNPHAVAALRAEATRLRHMEEKGHLVPHVYAQEEKHLVLSHLGTCLADAIELSPDTDSRRGLFTRAASHLASVHKDGEYHGRALTKDMTVQGDRIGMIDLEHEPLKVMPLADAQARDFWYLAFDAAEYHAQDSDLVTGMLEAYANQAPPDAMDSLYNGLRVMTPATSVIKIGLRLSGQNHYTAKVANMNSALLAQLR